MRLHKLSGSGEDAVIKEAEENVEVQQYSMPELVRMLGSTVGFAPDLRAANKIMSDEYGFNFLELIVKIAKNPKNAMRWAHSFNRDIGSLGDLYFEDYHDPHHDPHHAFRGMPPHETSTHLIDIVMQVCAQMNPEFFTKDKTAYWRIRQAFMDKEDGIFPAIEKNMLDNYGVHVNLDKKIPLPTSPSRYGRGMYGHGEHMSPIAALSDMFLFFKQAIEFGVWAWGIVKRWQKGEPMSEIAKYVEQYEQSSMDPNTPQPEGTVYDNITDDMKTILKEKETEAESKPEPEAKSSLSDEFTIEPEEPVEPEQPEPKKPEPKKKVSDEVRLKNEFDTVKNLLTSKKLTKPRFDMFKKQYETFSISFGEIGEIKKFINDIDRKGGAVFA